MFSYGPADIGASVIDGAVCPEGERPHPVVNGAWSAQATYREIGSTLCGWTVTERLVTSVGTARYTLSR